MKILDFFSAYWEYKKLNLVIILLILFVTVAGSFLLLKIKPFYSATSILLLKPPQEELKFVDVISDLGGVDPLRTLVYTYCNIIMSDRLCEKTVDKLMEEGIPSEPPTFFKKAYVDYFLPFQNKVIELYYVLNFGEFKGFPSNRDILKQKLKKNLLVENIMNSYMLTITLTSDKPVLVAKAVNTLVNIFIDYEVESKREDLRTVRNEIEKELDELSQKLRAADENISRFMQDNKIVSLENEISLSLQRIADLETKLSSQESKKADIQTRIREIETQLTEFGKSHLALPGIDVDKNFMKLQDELSALEEEKLKLISSPFRPGDEEKLLEIGRKIEGAKALISNYIIKTLGLSFAEEMPIFSNLLQTLTQYTTDSAAITAESDAIKRIISELSAGIKKLPVLDLELVRLTQDRDRIKSLYDERLKSALDLKITESFKLSEVRVVEPAKVPQYPDFPMMLVNGIIAVAVGVFISFFVVLFLEFVKNPVRSAEHAEEILGIKYLGSVSKKI